MQDSTKTAIRAAVKPFSPLLRAALNGSAGISLRLSRAVGLAYNKLWPVLGVYWYDHTFDHLLGPSRNQWAERGFIVNHLLPKGGTVLDIACGDGFYSGNYYAGRASHVDAFDYDPKAIAVAKRKHSRPNVDFFVADATAYNFPSAAYDVVAMFACIEHFTAEDGARILQGIGRSLWPDGVLIGSTPIFTSTGNHNDEHKNEFLSADALREFLAEHFASVELWFSEWPFADKTMPARRECYFECRLVPPAGTPAINR